LSGRRKVKFEGLQDRSTS